MIPVIRFKGFTDDWEQRKFEDVFEFPVATNSLSRSQLNYENGLIKSVHYGDILIKYNSILDIKKDPIPYINEGTLEKYNSNLLKNGDIIFADAAEDETVGKAVEVIGLTDENLVAGLHTIVARSKGIKGPYFLGYYINSDAFHHQLLRLMQGTKVSSISKGSLKETKVCISSNFEEQQKIGTFFKELDDTIALHQEKLELLKKMKKSYLQKMFPKKDETVPEIRFAGFTDDWEQRKVKEVCSISTGKSNTQDKIDMGDYPFYVRSATIERSTKYLYDEEAVLTVGDGVGTGKVYHYVNGKYDLHQRVYRMFDFKNISAKYFFYYFSNHFYRRAQAMTAKTSVDSVRLEMISDMSIQFPNIEEQQKVASFFTTLDDTIALHQRKLDQMKEMKKAFLQKLFI